MGKLNVTPEYKPEMEAWDIDTSDYYGNWNEAHRHLLGNDAALKNMIDEKGLSVVNGKLCITYETEE